MITRPGGIALTTPFKDLKAVETSTNGYVTKVDDVNEFDTLGIKNGGGSDVDHPVPKPRLFDASNIQRWFKATSPLARMPLPYMPDGRHYFSSQRLPSIKKIRLPLFGMPVSASTVFDQCEHLSNAIFPVFKCFKRLAANIGHAGEFLDDILKWRSPGQASPLVMSDALSHNHVPRSPLSNPCATPTDAASMWMFYLTSQKTSKMY